MKQHELYERIQTRKQRLSPKENAFNLLLLFVPSLTEILLFVGAGVTSIVTIGISFLLLLLSYFVLPMFYTVEKRVRYAMAGIRTDFTYRDGYKAFFTSAQGGIFGILTSLLYASLLFFLAYLIFGNLFPYVCNVFPGASEVFQTGSKILLGNSADPASKEQASRYLLDNFYLLARPMMLEVAIILFLPSLYFLFFGVDSALADHEISTIVLPDIDLNLSASQSRALAHGSFRRLLQKDFLPASFRLNWPYYLSYILLYGLVLYGCLSIPVSPASNLYLLLFEIFLTPVLLLFVGFYLNYFILRNNDALLEEITPLLLGRLPAPMKETIRQTYRNPSYVHGQESALRGSFVPEDKAFDDREKPMPKATYSDKHETYSSPVEVFDPSKPQGGAAPAAEKKDDGPKAFVVDFSDTATKDVSETKGETEAKPQDGGSKDEGKTDPEPDSSSSSDKKEG